MSLTIKFEAGLRPVFKHQEHDQSSHGSWATGGLQIQAKQFNTFEEFSNAISQNGLRPKAWHIADEEFELNPDYKPTNRLGGTSSESGLFVGDPETWQDYATGRETVIEYDVTGLTWTKNPLSDTKADFYSDQSGNQGFFVRPQGFGKLKEVGRFTLAEAISRAQKQQSEMPNSKDEAKKIWESLSNVKKHQQHDQKTHGSWATGNFNEETEGEDAQNTYFETYGIKTDGSKDPVGISRDEVRSLNDYTADGYAAINGYLRRFDRNPNEEDSINAQQFRQMLENRVTDIDKIIEEAPELFGDKNLYRVFDKSVLDTLEEGDVLTDKGFMSTTRVDITSKEGLDVLQNLQIIRTTDNKPSIILPSESKTGKGIAVDYVKNAVSDLFDNISTADNEKEVLLPRETSIKFMGYKKINEGKDDVMDVAVFQRLDK
jgi:hypothetical protein